MQHDKLIKQVYDQAVAYAQSQKWVDGSWTCGVRVDTSPRRTRSWGGTRGGKPFISLALHPHRDGNFVEYSSFACDPEIGSVAGSVDKAIATLVVHEIAHAIQFSGNAKTIAGNNVQASKDTGGHGALWRKIYRELRNHIINNREWPAVGAVVQPSTSAAPSRTEALKIATHLFKEGKTAGEIIRSFITRGMKKTTATTYVYAAKSAGGF